MYTHLKFNQLPKVNKATKHVITELKDGLAAEVTKLERDGWRADLPLYLFPHAFASEGGEKNPVYLGWEWELTPHGSRYEQADTIRDLWNKGLKWYAVPGIGGEFLEIRSMPATLKHHKKASKDFLGSKLLRRFRRDLRNGIHVHIDATYIDRDTYEKMVAFLIYTPNHLNFLNKFTKDRISKNEYCKVYEEDQHLLRFNRKSGRLIGLDGLVRSYHAPKYFVVGWDDKSHPIEYNVDFGTYELRIFPSTTDGKEFLSYLEFSEALVKFCQKYSLVSMNIPVFMQFVAKNKDKYEHLYETMKEKANVSGVSKITRKAA